ncbi:MAG: SIS domain-containing protein [Candidatus Omnitrophota bacterium]
MKIVRYAETVRERIRDMKAYDRSGDQLAADEAMERIIGFMADIPSSGGKVIFIGNGGSASIASHMAVDFWKNGKIKAVSFNDPSQLTCLSNDNGYENVFSIPIGFFAEEGDVLVAISSSGASPSILNAADEAREKKCRVVTLSGFKEDNPLKEKGDVNIFVADMSYGIVETAHAMLCHYFLDSVIERQSDV